MIYKKKFQTVLSSTASIRWIWGVRRSTHSSNSLFKYRRTHWLLCISTHEKI